MIMAVPNWTRAVEAAVEVEVVSSTSTPDVVPSLDVIASTGKSVVVVGPVSVLLLLFASVLELEAEAAVTVEELPLNGICVVELALVVLEFAGVSGDDDDDDESEVVVQNGALVLDTAFVVVAVTVVLVLVVLVVVVVVTGARTQQKPTPPPFESQYPRKLDFCVPHEEIALKPDPVIFVTIGSVIVLGAE
jgi:hypothetical protein